MPPSLIRRAIAPLLDGIIGITERAIELLGDPDLHLAVERDRRALGLYHRRLVEAYEEIEDLQGVLRVATTAAVRRGRCPQCCCPECKGETDGD